MDKENSKKAIENPMQSKLGEIVLYTDGLPTKQDILDAKKKQLREMRALRGES